MNQGFLYYLDNFRHIICLSNVSIVPRALFCFRFIPCCWMPFVMNCSKDVVHTCPSCRAVCGEFKRQQQGRVHHGGGMHRRRGRRRRRR